MSILFRPLFCAFSALLAITVLSGCGRGDALEQIIDRGELRVVSRNSPTTYYQDRNGPTGFEYALATLLAEDLGVELSIHSAFTLEAIFGRLLRHKADVAAAGLTLTGERQAQFPHSRAYEQITPQIVYVAGNFRPRQVADLVGLRVAVLADSAHADGLRALRHSGFERLSWVETAGVDSMALLALVNRGDADVAIIDSNEFTVQQGLYPRLRVAFDLGTEQQLAWFLPPDTDNEALLARINSFFERLRASGKLDYLREQYFGHAAGVSRVGSHTFTSNMRKKLPRHRELIAQVAAEYQLDWELLAAVAYQESHWNPRATSPTGVRGMMMLTLITAGELGVENRLDPVESLRGGARYLKSIKRRLPERIDEPDRTWFALAAYNVGMGHLRDARRITERQGGNPDRWADVVTRLPLLQDQQYYRHTSYGFARGSEAVTYVQNIRHYYNILKWQGIAENRPQPPLKADDYLPRVIKEAPLLAL